MVVLCILVAVIAAAVAAGMFFLKEKTATVFVPASQATLQAASWPDEPESAQSQTIQYVSHVPEGLDQSDNEFNYAYVRAYWDDAWFASDGRVYNHQLAATAMALNAAVNAETQHYSSGAKSNDCARAALAGFGFGDIDTSSFEGVSTIADEAKLFLSRDMDQTAWTFASKTIGAGLDAYELVYVGIRGTYLTEWFSDAALSYPEWESATKDHIGYRLAALQLQKNLNKYLAKHKINTDRMKLMVSGHSRGGSVANLVAHDILQKVGKAGQIVPAENLFAYTFATSATTCDESAGDERFAGIHNIVNPTDMVPMMPLKKWGFACYGTMHSFPSMSDPDFDRLYSAMQGNRALMTGCENKEPYHYGEANPAESVIGKVGEEVPDLASFKKKKAIVDIVKILAPADVYRIFVSHFPDTYMAWMQATTENDLR